jgi:hypothetical protein
LKEQANYEIKQLKPLDEKDVTWPSLLRKPPRKEISNSETRHERCERRSD